MKIKDIDAIYRELKRGNQALCNTIYTLDYELVSPKGLRFTNSSYEEALFRETTPNWENYSALSAIDFYEAVRDIKVGKYDFSHAIEDSINYGQVINLDKILWNGQEWIEAMQALKQYAEMTSPGSQNIDKYLKDLTISLSNVAHKHGGLDQLQHVWKRLGPKDVRLSEIIRDLGSNPNQRTTHYTKLVLDHNRRVVRRSEMRQKRV
ncbi:hypothetical protein [Chitinophaga arvensicola]|nr:hypothetical protein [Chitinophaga arvensicola]